MAHARWLVTDAERKAAVPGSLEAKFIDFVKMHNLPVEPEQEEPRLSTVKRSWWQPWVAVITMTVLAFAPTPALANGDDDDNGNSGGGGGSVHHNITGTGGQGGQGGTGFGGHASQAQTIIDSGNSRNRNTNRNDNTNVNRNRNRQSQDQLQGQKQGQQQGQRQGSTTSGNVQGGNTVGGSSMSVDSGDVPRQAPSAHAPNLVAAPETCMGSTAVGASTPFGGVSVGTTYKSDDCEIRMFARSLMALGQKEAALALLAQNAKVAAALRATGYQAAWLHQEKDRTPAPIAQGITGGTAPLVTTTQGP